MPSPKSTAWGNRCNITRVFPYSVVMDRARPSTLMNISLLSHVSWTFILAKHFLLMYSSPYRQYFRIRTWVQSTSPNANGKLYLRCHCSYAVIILFTLEGNRIHMWTFSSFLLNYISCYFRNCKMSNSQFFSSRLKTRIGYATKEWWWSIIFSKEIWNFCISLSSFFVPLNFSQIHNWSHW